MESFKHSLAVSIDIEEALHHAHAQRLAEPSGSGKQRYFVVHSANEIIQQFRLIYIVEAGFSDFIKALLTAPARF